MGLRDLWVLRKLQHDGMPLALQANLWESEPPLRRALASYLWLDGASVATYITRARHEDGVVRGFVQVQQRRGRSEADLLHIAPAPCTAEVSPLWERLLTAVNHWATENGILRLYAAAPVDSLEESALRRCGFIRFTVDTIYRLPEVPGKIEPVSEPPLRPQLDRDTWGLQRLYAAVTPLRVQQAEGLAQNGWRVPTDDWNGQAWTMSLVWEDRDGLQAHLGLRRGSASHYFRLVTRAEVAANLPALIGQALLAVSRWPKRPVYCAVRQYQEGLGAALEDAGFTPVAQRALTVRHSVLTVRPALEEMVLRLQSVLGGGYNPSASERCGANERSATLAVSIPATEWDHDEVSDYR